MPVYLSLCAHNFLFRMNCAKDYYLIVFGRLHLEDLAATCKEILDVQGGTSCSAMAADTGERKMLVDLDLQRMLKDMWGSDSEDSNDSTDGDEESVAENEEEEMEILYEYMSTQRQKMRGRDNRGNASDKSHSAFDNKGIEDERRMVGDVDVNANTHVSNIDAPMSCRDTPTSHIDTPTSHIMDASHVDTSTSDNNTPTSHIDTFTLNLDMPNACVNTLKSTCVSHPSDGNMYFPLHRFESMSDQARSCEDNNPTVESVSKVLFECTQAHSDFQKDVLASPDGGIGIGCDSKEFTTNLEHCISATRKAKKACIVMQCKDGDTTHLSGGSDGTMSMKKGGSPSGVAAPSHDSFSEVSDLENSALDLFESFLPDDGSRNQEGSTVASETCGDQTDSIVKLEERKELTDCSEELVTHDALVHYSEGLVTHDALVHYSEGLVTHDALVHYSEGLVNHKVDCTEACPCAPSLACGHSDSPESLAVPQVTSLTSDAGIIANRRTTWNAMTTLPSRPRLDVNDIAVSKVDTSGSFSQSVRGDTQDLTQSLSDPSCTGCRQFTCDDIGTIATDHAPMSDTIDLTQDDIPEDMPPLGSNSHQVGKSLLCTFWFRCHVASRDSMSSKPRQIGGMHSSSDLFHKPFP